MEFCTEEEMREVLGTNAKGYNNGYGWRSCDAVKNERTIESSTKKVLIGCYVGSSIMYLAKRGTTFIKAEAKQFDNVSSTDTKVKMMNQRGNYDWKKIPVV